MKIIGHGIDLVEINHIRKIIERSGENFEKRCFTAMELDAHKSKTNYVQYLAGRFVAKEAVLKALGSGWSENVSFLDVEIQRLTTGQPSVLLHARCKEIAIKLGITSWLLSISHTSNHAIASAIAVGPS